MRPDPEPSQPPPAPPPNGARQAWELADVLADRLRWYADCPNHPAASPDDDCAHCRDRAAWRLYLAACESAGRIPAAGTS